MSEQKYCKYCCNASVEPELTHDNDLSYLTVGKSLEGTNLYFRSGNGQPTAIVVSQWNQDRNENEDVAIYEMKYCPECGRKLIENKKRISSAK